MAGEMDELATLVADLREKEALLALQGHLEAGVPPDELFRACQKGMCLAGSMHEKGQYFLAGLIMAGEIMRQALDLIRPLMLKKESNKTSGRVLLGTIEGDIHDIGKDLFKDLLECHGFTVLDLGVDVPPAQFVAEGARFKPRVVAVSTLLTGGFSHLRELVELFDDAARRKSYRRPLILIGGGMVDERVFRMSGADHWGADAFAGLKICLRLLKQGKKPDRSATHRPGHILNATRY